jgi:membrane protein YqaA with SNARE-associated domain
MHILTQELRNATAFDGGDDFLRQGAHGSLNRGHAQTFICLDHGKISASPCGALVVSDFLCGKLVFPDPAASAARANVLGQAGESFALWADLHIGVGSGRLFGYSIGYYAYETIGISLLKALGMWDTFPAAACYLREYGAEIILVKGATPIPFKLITLSAGFIHMNLFTFIWASMLSRSFQFMLVGFLFWKFGAPIKLFLEKYLTMLSIAFVVIVVGGFVAASLLSGGGGDTGKCAQIKTMAQLEAM